MYFLLICEPDAGSWRWGLSGLLTSFLQNLHERSWSHNVYLWTTRWHFYFTASHLLPPWHRRLHTKRTVTHMVTLGMYSSSDQYDHGVTLLLWALINEPDGSIYSVHIISVPIFCSHFSFPIVSSSFFFFSVVVKFLPVHLNAVLPWLFLFLHHFSHEGRTGTFLSSPSNPLFHPLLFLYSIFLLSDLLPASLCFLFPSHFLPTVLFSPPPPHLRVFSLASLLPASSYKYDSIQSAAGGTTGLSFLIRIWLFSSLCIHWHCCGPTAAVLQDY